MYNNYQKRVEQPQQRGRPNKPPEPQEVKQPEVVKMQVLGLRCPHCGREIIPKTEYTWKTYEGTRAACHCPQCGKKFVIEKPTNGKTVIRLK